MGTKQEGALGHTGTATYTVGEYFFLTHLESRGDHVPNTRPSFRRYRTRAADLASLFHEHVPSWRKVHRRQLRRAHDVRCCSPVQKLAPMTKTREGRGRNGCVAKMRGVGGLRIREGGVGWGGGVDENEGSGQTESNKSRGRARTTVTMVIIRTGSLEQSLQILAGLQSTSVVRKHSRALTKHHDLRRRDKKNAKAVCYGFSLVGAFTLSPTHPCTRLANMHDSKTRIPGTT